MNNRTVLSGGLLLLILMVVGPNFGIKITYKIFHWHNSSGRTMALGLTQPVTEKSTRNISWGVKAAGT